MNSRTSPPARWACTRAPSSFHSTEARPTSAIASATSAAGDANIGWTAVAGLRPTASSAGSPPTAAIRAAPGKDPVSIAARRTAATVTPVAAATDDVTTPASAPWRRSPPMIAASIRCSGSVACARRSCRRSRRRATEPGPATSASRPIARSTSATVRVASVAGAGRTSRSVAHPTPNRPTSVSPVANATAAGSSSGPHLDSTSAKTATFSDRFDVAALATEARASSANNM